MTKDPKRWQDVIINSSFGRLTKQDVHDYYQRPDIKNKILTAIKATGSPETILRQSFSPGHTVLRRKDHQGNLIDLSRAKDFNDWSKLRMTEVHPVFGETTNTLLADIDPGDKVPWNKVKAIAETIAKTMNTSDDVKDVQVQFSGDRGFYVKGILNQAINVNDARNKVKELMSGLTKRPDVTLDKAGPKEIRVDTTPLKNRGSVKAPYSLSAVTGLVAAPVEMKDLMNVQKSDFKIDKIKTAALYHGSPVKTDRLEPGGYHGDPKIPAAVFASPLREFALAYSGGKWGDRDIEQGLHSESDKLDDATVELREMRPGVFKEVFQQPGYMYELPDDGFVDNPRDATPWERIRTKAVLPKKVERIANVAAALHAAKNVRMIPYDEAESRRLMLSDRRVNRLLELPPKERAQYLDWYGERVPASLVPDLKKLRERVSAVKTATLSGVRNEILRADLERAMSTYDTVEDKAHGRPHVENVIRAAQLLNQQFRLPQDRVLAAAALHDIGNPVDRKQHHIIGAQLAPQYLGAMNPRSRAAVIHAIREHRYSKGNPRSNLAKMVNDADTMSDFTTEDDPDYFFRRLVQYRKSKGMPQEEVYDEALNYGRPWLQRALNGGLRTQQALDTFRPHVERALKNTESPEAFREFLRPMVEQEYQKTGAAEFAPGIPAAKTIDPIPSIKNKAWTLSIQQHDAKKAGKHYDVRLVDPKSQKAHSFAVPRGRLPGKGDRMLLAVQQPTHTADYALNFEGKIPAGTYGAGQVKIKLQEPVNVVKANADRLQFERPDGRGYVLFRTQGNNWGFKQKKT